jgi:hypothetical protein
MIATLPVWVRDILTAIPQAGGASILVVRRSRFVEVRAEWRYSRSSRKRSGHLWEIRSNVRSTTQFAIRRSVRFNRGPFNIGLACSDKAADSDAEHNAARRFVEANPVKFTDNKVHSEEIIDALFPGNPLLCVGRSQADFDTKPRNKWRGELSGQQFIVPSPMIKWVGRTQEGKESAHAKESTGLRRFLVIEQDRGTVDEQSAVLWHLAAPHRWRSPFTAAGNQFTAGSIAPGKTKKKFCALL